MKTESIEQFLSRGGKIKKVNFKKPKPVKIETIPKHMSTAKTHVYWKEENGQRS